MADFAWMWMSEVVRGNANPTATYRIFSDSENVFGGNAAQHTRCMTNFLSGLLLVASEHEHLDPGLAQLLNGLRNAFLQAVLQCSCTLTGKL